LEPEPLNSVYERVEQESFWDFVWLAFEGWIGNIVLVLLALMSVGMIGITINRFRTYKATRKASMNFHHRVRRTLRDHSLHELVCIAQHHKSPAAIVIASGLVAFQKARALGFDAALEAAKRATKLSARDVHMRMNRGLNYLAAIVVTALFVGVFGTCYGILTGFKGCGASREDCIAAYHYEISRAIVPTAWGFLIAIPSMWVHRYLDESEVDSCDLEVETVSLDLLNYLSTRTPAGEREDCT
jgi:biopolymer transport protein ExbB